MDAVQDALASYTLENRYEELVSWIDQCKMDRPALRTKDSRVAGLQTDLDITEFRLIYLEQKLGLNTLEQIEHIHSNSDDISVGITKTSAIIPSLSEQFCDRKGDFGVQLERSYDLQGSYLEDKARHEFLLDRGELVDDTTSDLSKHYEEQQHRIFLALDTAKQDANAMEEACKEAGIAVDADRFSWKDELLGTMALPIKCFRSSHGTGRRTAMPLPAHDLPSY